MRILTMEASLSRSCSIAKAKTTSIMCACVENTTAASSARAHTPQPLGHNPSLDAVTVIRQSCAWAFRALLLHQVHYQKTAHFDQVKR